MVSNINTPHPPDEANADAQRLREAATREASSAREEAKKAGSTVADEASRLASDARDKAYEGAESGKAYAASSLDDFTAAIKKASDELGERDQSMAANLVREAASGLEQVSSAIEGKSVQELTRSAAGFARRQPAAFLIGAVLAGVAIGRFAKASSEHSESDYAGSGASGRDGQGSSASRYDERYSRPSASSGAGRDVGAGSSAGGAASFKPASSGPGASTEGSPFGTSKPSTSDSSRPGSVSSTKSASSTTPSSTGFTPSTKGGDHER